MKHKVNSEYICDVFLMNLDRKLNFDIEFIDWLIDLLILSWVERLNFVRFFKVKNSSLPGLCHVRNLIRRSRRIPHRLRWHNLRTGIHRGFDSVHTRRRRIMRHRPINESTDHHPAAIAPLLRYHAPAVPQQLQRRRRGIRLILPRAHHPKIRYRRSRRRTVDSHRAVLRRHHSILRHHHSILRRQHHSMIFRHRTGQQSGGDRTSFLHQHSIRLLARRRHRLLQTRFPRRLDGQKNFRPFHRRLRGRFTAESAKGKAAFRRGGGGRKWRTVGV